MSRYLSIIFAVLLVPFSNARAQLITFEEGLESAQWISGFYGGWHEVEIFPGIFDFVQGEGPDLGVVFRGAKAFCRRTLEAPTCTGQFANNPSGTFVMSPDERTVRINVFDGFLEQFSFWYTAPEASAIVQVWSDLGGTGDLLGMLEIEPFSETAGCRFCDWTQRFVNFTGIGKSVTILTSETNAVGFDDLRFGVAPGGPTGPAVPEPGTFGLTAAGLGALLVLARRRRARHA